MYKITVPAAVWQWDINDTIAVEGIEDISKWQVHFASTGDSNALVLEINPDMTCYIPNQLVELGQAIYAYLYNVEEQRAYTETAVLISVKARPRPLDYISTPTDVLTWGQLRADIGTLSQLVTEDKTNLVAAVNELHRDIETAKTEQDKDITAIQSDIDDIKQDITDIKDTDAAQSRQIAQNQQDIDELAQSDTQLANSVSSLAQTVDKGFKRVQTELDKKQPVGDYITNAVDNLVNYYLKSETYTRSEVKDLIGSLTHINIKIVSSTDDVTEPNVIYLVPVSSGESDDYYNEYILVNGNPELIGNTRVDLSDYYTMEQTNDLLNDKQPLGNYVTSVNGNAPDEGGNVVIDVQTYTAGDGVDISDSGTISVTNPMDDAQVSETTTWSSAKIISSVSQSFSQSGSIITCHPVEGSPLHVVSEITAVQEGTGDPSPDNVRPIVGYNSANLVRCGKNLFDVDVIESYTLTNDSYITNNGDGSITVTTVTTNSAAGTRKSLNQLCHMIKPNIYILTANSTGTEKHFYSATWEENGTWNFGSQKTLLSSMMDSSVWACASGANTTATISNIQIELGTTATTYEPYRGQTYTADFGETVYGGTLDWATGVLTVTWQQFQITDSTRLVEVESWSRPEENTIAVAIIGTGHKAGNNNIAFNKLKYGSIFSDFAPWIYVGNTSGGEVYVRVPGTTLEEARQNMVSQSIVGITEISTPYTIQLTPAQVLAISGTNTVYCDTGDVTVTGYEDPRTTIANLSARIAALESAAAGI